MFRKHNTYLLVIILLCFGVKLNAQSANDSVQSHQNLANETLQLAKQDSIKMAKDSINRQHRLDSLTLFKDPSERKTPTKEVFENEIVYTADSIVGQGTGVFLLFGNASVSYGSEMNLTADFIRMNMDSSVIYAAGRKDSAGAWIGRPVFDDGGSSYTSDDMIYNFNSGKAYITNTVTEQGEGYVTANETKKISDNAYCMRGGKYTTCDHHHHPHFYLEMSKAKVHPGENIVTGPAHLVMEGVHLPLFIPFGFFPMTDSYSSGFIIPEFGEENSRGFFLSNGGYYFAINDYFDLKVLGSIYSLGSWDVSGASTYKKRYKYSGNFSAKYMVNVSGEKTDPDYYASKDFRINWSHRQDSKANMYQTFSASVNFSTSSYDRNNVNTIYNPSVRSQNHKQSSISYSRRFANAPFSLSASALASQNSSDSTLTLSLPQMNVSMSRIYPFKRKVQVGKTRWYEKVGLSYTGTMSNKISGKEDEVFNSDLIRDWSNGIKHSIPLSTSFNIKTITISPSVSYNERWYSSRIEKSTQADSTVLTDTIWGFNRVYDYSGSVSASTKLYGFYTPVIKIFGGKVQKIRHVVTPSVSFSYRPDFSQDRYGFYDTYQELEYDSELEEYVLVDEQYSKYQGALYGNAPTGKSGTISMSLGNNLEMKVRSDRDTAEQTKKIKLIESLNMSTSYNMAKDSLNWSNISMNFRTKIFKNFGLNLRATFDPYKYEVNRYGKAVHVNQMWIQDGKGKIGQLTRASTSFSYSLDNKKLKKLLSGEGKEEGNDDGQTPPDQGENQPDMADREGGPGQRGEKEMEKVEKDPYGYEPFTMPWNLSFSFSYSLTSSFNAETENYDYKNIANLRVNGGISLTDKWKISGSSGYDFQNKEITSTSFNLTRDLHCWSMNMSFVPFGPYKTYMFTVKVNSSILQDLKYEQRKSSWDSGAWD